MLKNLRKKAIEYKLIIVFALIVVNFACGFFLSGDLWILLISAVWIFLGYFYRFDEKIYFGMAIFFLLASLPFLLFNRPFLSEKMAVWEFIFIIIGAGWGLIRTFKK